jgi:hypothetical protein
MIADEEDLCWLARKSCRAEHSGILEPAQVYCDE